MKPRTPILVLDGESFLTRKVVRSLAQTGRWQIHVLEKRTGGRRPGLEWSRHVSSFHTFDEGLGNCDYADAVLGAVRQAEAQVILPVLEDSVQFCIRNRGVLEEWASLVPVPTEAAMSTAIDKGRLAAFMHGQGIAHPSSLGDTAFANLRFPLLVKPTRSSNGCGIVQVADLGELNAEMNRRKADGDYLVQEVIPGYDMGCSILARDGRIEAWTMQRGLTRTDAFAPCAELAFEWNEEVAALVQKLVTALRWSGVANIDLRIDQRTGEPLILEVNGRYWATLLGSTAAGVNFPDLACRLALGESLPASCQSDGQFVSAVFLGRSPVRVDLRSLKFGWREIAMLVADPLPELVCWWTRHRAYGKDFPPVSAPVPTRA